MKRTNTIEWTTITADEQTWPNRCSGIKLKINKNTIIPGISEFSCYFGIIYACRGEFDRISYRGKNGWHFVEMAKLVGCKWSYDMDTVQELKSKVEVSNDIKKKTIKWTTITEEESTWPPEKFNVCLESNDDGRYRQKSRPVCRYGDSFRTIDFYGDEIIHHNPMSMVHNFFGLRWRPMPKPPKKKKEYKSLWRDWRCQNDNGDKQR